MPDVIEAAAIFLFLWFVGAPLLTLLHELGHATASLILTGGAVVIELGADTRPFILRLGRLQVKLRFASGSVGFHWAQGLPDTRWRRAAIILGGPLASFLTMAVCFATPESLDKALDSIEIALFWLGVGAFIQFAVTAWPMRYPAGWPGYAGMLSDGAQIRALFSESGSPGTAHQRQAVTPSDHPASPIRPLPTGLRTLVGMAYYGRPSTPTGFLPCLKTFAGH